ncbi:hypothetical protein HPP92_008108 [Vanilla planifolia]|uniref:Hexosyltransferase n=1 Tax=Vanilla planifolia TaxID=51239 RepID=A0A835R928_VANPL|nr:hypothetical protein HPP92_008108 [Vanilla planifolia]
MQLRISPSMRSITISSSNGVLDSMKVKVGARPLSYRTLFYTILALAFLLPFVFILTAVVTLEGVDNCSSLDCLGRRLSPKFLRKGQDDSARLIRDLYEILSQVKSEEISAEVRLPGSFKEFLSEMKDNQYDIKTFAILLKATIENMDKEVKRSKLAEQLNKHFAAGAIPKGIHCLSLRLADEYSSNANARKQLPPPEMLPLLSDNSYQHFILSTDNVLAASVVVNSVVSSSLRPEKIVFHVITDKKLIQLCIHAIESHHGVRNHYHGNHMKGANITDDPKAFASKLQARSPKYISLLNHLRMYLPELFPNLNKVVFLDDDVVIQRDLSPLWNINMEGKVNAAVETCRGDDKWVMSKRFHTYFNFSHPIISKSLNPDECAWAYGMNIFDLNAWRKTRIRDIYNYWLKENLKSNLTLWKFGTLPPALIAFRGHIHPIDPSWHVLGLGYQEKTNLDSVRKAAVIHYNGQCALVVGG